MSHHLFLYICTNVKKLIMGIIDRTILINRLAKIKYLYNIGLKQSKQVGAFAGFSILSFHDSAEMFLLLVLEDKGDPRPKSKQADKISFMGYWNLFEDLTLKESMNNLKERRKNIKHKGLFPSKSDIEESRITIMQFFRENVKIQFGLEFDDISLADLIEYNNIKNYIRKSEELLSLGKTYDCLLNAKIGFEELLVTYESDKRQWRDSIFSIGKKVGTDYRRLVTSDKDGRKWFEEVTMTSNAIRDILRISAMGIDYRKYALFEFITPRVIETCGIGDDKYAKEDREHFELTKSIKQEDCQFCIDFVIDSTLKLQEFDFNIGKYIKEQQTI